MMGAKEYLEQIRLYDTNINHKLDDIERLNALVTKVTSTWKGDVVSGGGNQDKLGDAVARIVDLRNEVNQAIDDYVDKKREVCNVLDRLKNPDHIRVLRLRYFGIYDEKSKEVHYPTWEEIACVMHMTYRNVCYIHGRALQTVGRLLRDGKCET